MDWLANRFKEKSTYAGLATIGFTVLQSFIPIPVSSDVVQMIAGAVLVGISENKNKR